MATAQIPGAFRTPTGARTLAQILADLDERAGSGEYHRPSHLSTGFDPLDMVTGGGLHPHDLVLIGGAPGVGKTIACLQSARNIARSGHRAIYACYEHDLPTLAERLLWLELGELARTSSDNDLLRTTVREVSDSRRTLAGLAREEPLVGEAVKRLAVYADRLWLVRAAGSRTGLEELEDLATQYAHGPTALFVDYLQKVSVRPEPADEGEKVLRVAEGLKELALSSGIAVVAIVAADRSGLDAHRLRLHHLRGSSALAYESDVVIMLNEKARAVSKVHLAYDPVRAQAYNNYVVFTIEKNRSGQAHIDMEFRKDFAHYRFEPHGGYVAERLVDERLFED